MREWHQWRTGTGNVLRETIGISIASNFLTGNNSVALDNLLVTDSGLHATRIISKLTTWLEKSNRLRAEGIFRVCGNAISFLNLANLTRPFS